MLPTKPCKHCKETQPKHWPYQCKANPKKPKRIKQIGKGTIKYNQWRDSVAKPYLFTQGNFCAICGKASKHLDVDHIKKRGSHPQLKMNIDNVRLVCRSCHIKIT